MGFDRICLNTSTGVALGEKERKSNTRWSPAGINALSYVAAQHSVRRCRKGAEAENQWDIVTDAMGEEQFKFGVLTDISCNDDLSYMSFPSAHWALIASTTRLERVQRTFRVRRCHRYLPERRGHRPPGGALILETNDKWAVARHYVLLETLARATDNPTGYPGP